MTLDEQGIDQAGDEVLKFVSAARNYTRVGELVEEIGRIAHSSSWRRYRTASGTNEWLAAEFDYFLIACDLPYEDVARVIAYSREQDVLAELMDREADSSRRRPLEKAAEAWHSGANESLLQRAQRLNWMKTHRVGREGNRRAVATGLKVAPLPGRFLAYQRDGLTKEERARQNRAQRIETKRRAALDDIAATLLEQVSNKLERRYLVDLLKDSLTQQEG